MSLKRELIFGVSETLSQYLKICIKKLNGSILIISHQERILSIADRIIIIADGEIQNSGTREEILPELLGSVTQPGTCRTLTEKLV